MQTLIAPVNSGSLVANIALGFRARRFIPE